MYSKLRFELRLRQDTLGSKLLVDADAILRQLMENEGDGHMLQAGAGDGVTSYGSVVSPLFLLRLTN